MAEVINSLPGPSADVASGEDSSSSGDNPASSGAVAQRLDGITTPRATSPQKQRSSTGLGGPLYRSYGKERTLFVRSWPQQSLADIEKRVVDHLKAANNANGLIDDAFGAMKNTSDPDAHTWEECQQALQTLLTYLLNIRHHPDSAQFKRIGVYNPNFKWKVQSVAGAVEILMLIGFRLNAKGDCMELTEHSLNGHLLNVLIDRIQKELTLLFQHNRFVRKKGLQGSPLRERPVELSPSMRFPIGYADMTGRRPTMEDQFVIRGAYRGHADEDFIALFDGHGGKGAADLSAATLYQEIWKHITLHKEVGVGDDVDDEDQIIRKVVRESFLATNSKICQTLHMINDYSGTTVLMTWIAGGKIITANAGDSRAVLYKDSGKIVRLSRDHRPEDPEEKERIESLGGRVITLPQDAPRLNGTLSVSRGFGDFDLQPCLSPEPYINIVPISPDDRYLILGCDGLWDEVEEDRVGELLTKWRKQIKEQARQREEDQSRLRRMTSTSSSTHSSNANYGRFEDASEAYQLARMLVDYSYTCGSYDNISVIIVQLKE